MAKPNNTVLALEEARDRLFSLEANPDDLKMELRQPFRGGFAQCKKFFLASLNQMIAERSVK